ELSGNAVSRCMEARAIGSRVNFHEGKESLTPMYQRKLPGVTAQSPSIRQDSGGRMSSNERLRTISAYNPPSPAKLISSKNIPYIRGLIAAFILSSILKTAFTGCCAIEVKHIVSNDT